MKDYVGLMGPAFANFLDALVRLEDYGGPTPTMSRVLENAAGDPNRQQTWAARRVVVKRVDAMVNIIDGTILQIRREESAEFGSF